VECQNKRKYRYPVSFVDVLVFENHIKPFPLILTDILPRFETFWGVILFFYHSGIRRKTVKSNESMCKANPLATISISIDFILVDSSMDFVVYYEGKTPLIIIYGVNHSPRGLKQ
jgi:hypothetical protein